MTELERIALHDLWWTSGWDLGLGWEISEAQPYRGLSTNFVDVENDPDRAVAIERRAELRRFNPHLNVLVSLFYREGEYVANEEDRRWWELGHFPPDSPFWIRDEAGMPVPGFGEDADGDGVIEADEALSSLVDFRMPEVIELVAYQGGAPTHPVWYHNLVAYPDVRITFGGQTRPMNSRQLQDEEKAQLWPVCCEYYPPYQDYQARTDRNIPVFLCE